jgi:hypothetical protein
MDLMQTIPASKPGDSPMVYTFADYDFIFDGRDMSVDRQDWIAILLSLAKLTELYTLWKHGAPNLCWVAGAAWLYFFAAATILQLNKKWRCRIQTSSRKRRGVDIVAGYLPSAKHSGGERKVILGVSDNSRLSLLQRLVWAVGSVVCTAWLIFTYIILGQCEPKITLIWIAFQVLWLLSRLLFHHLADIKHPISHRIFPTPVTWTNMDYTMKERLLDLTLGLAQYQTYIHPRGAHAYAEDISTTTSLRSVFSQVQFRLQPEFALVQYPTTTGATTDVTISAVVGDHILASAAWMHGSTLSGMDLYDTCIIFLQSTILNSVIAVPSVRVLAQSRSAVPPTHDIETTVVPHFVPKGSSVGYDAWWCWIPCGKGLWLQLHSDDMKMLGRRKAEVMTDMEVTRKLQVGDLNISLTRVEEVREVVGLSMQTGQLLLQFFG